MKRVFQRCGLFLFSSSQPRQYRPRHLAYLSQLIPSNGLDDQDKLRALVYQAIVD